jgi:predicted metal-binding membrane protein
VSRWRRKAISRIRRTMIGRKVRTVPVDATLEAVIRRDRVVVITALFAVIALSWAYLLAGAGMGMSALEMTRMSQLGMARGVSEGDMASVAMMTPAVWTPGYAVLMLFMWWVMNVAMMLPSAAPMILLFATVNRKQRDTGHPYVATSIFAIGYLAAWAGFSLVAVMLQWGFERTGILSPMLVATNAIFGGFLLLAAGVYQLTPIKHACLRHCRSPLAFLSSHWRRGARGALRMGLLHGAFCVGCCWFLMGLMFFGGLMNLYWIAGLALFVLFEKTVAAGHWLGYATGVALLVWGAGMLALAF